MVVKSNEDDGQGIELALRKSEERFRLVVESAPNAIVTIGPHRLYRDGQRADRTDVRLLPQ